MSQETTQDLTQFDEELNGVRREAGGSQHEADDAECIATLCFEDVVEATNREFSLYPGKEFLVCRDPQEPSHKVQSLALLDLRVSKRHFRIYSIIYEPEYNRDTQSVTLSPLVYCEDLESSNGTFVNGELIGIIGKRGTAYLLCDGDVIEVRPNWKFTFHQADHRMVFPNCRQSRDMKHFVDRYSISSRILGIGHFAHVYLAKEVSTSRQVACKIVNMEVTTPIHSELSSDLSGTGASWKAGLDAAKKHRKQVLMEIEILSKLTHPNIINIHKAFCSQHSLYIFMDLSPAGDLFSYLLSRNGNLDDYDGRVVTKQITLALDYLHSQDIAHRDIKPENVLVTSTDFGGRVMLTDFGFARYATLTNGRLDRMKSRVGTAGYTAPEIDKVEMINLGYTKAADLWSLGKLTFTVLTGLSEIPDEISARLSQIETENRPAGFREIDSFYAQAWLRLSPRARKFLSRLLVWEPNLRVTVAEALQQSWYTQPSREAQALDEGLQRINLFWEKRKTYGDEVLEAFPGVVLHPSPAAPPPDPKYRKKIPDATSSTYFGLDRHLTQKAPSGRKRLLQDLNESGSPFLSPKEPQQPKSSQAANTPIQRSKGPDRAVSVEGADLFGKSMPKESACDPVRLMESLSNDHPDDSPADGEYGMNYAHAEGPSTLSQHLSSNVVAGSLDIGSKQAGKRYKTSDANPKTPVTKFTNLRDLPRYTSAEALRKSVRHMRL